MDDRRVSWWYRLKPLGKPSQYPFEELIVIGQLGKPHGLRGEMRCRPETDFPERFLDTEEVEIFQGDGPARRVTLESARIHQNWVIVKLAGVDTPEQAALWAKYLVAVGPDEVVELDEGYFHYELEGLQVFDPEGQLIGYLKEVLSNPAHEIYRIVGPAGEVLVPAVDEYILDIDIEQGRMVVRPPIYAED